MVNLKYIDHILAHYYLALCCPDNQLKFKLENAFLHLVNCKYDLGTFNPETDLNEFKQVYDDWINNLKEMYKNKHFSIETEFKKGNIPKCPFKKEQKPWNKGRIDLPSSWNKGLTGAKSHCSKTVIQYDLNGNFIKEWGSIGEIERETGFSHTAIGYCCNGKRKMSHNFIWKYKDNV